MRFSMLLPPDHPGSTDAQLNPCGSNPSTSDGLTMRKYGDTSKSRGV
jgi:hypothetical protein